MSNTYQELLQKRAELERQTADLERQLREAQGARREEGITKLQDIISEYALSIADVTSAFPKAAIRGPKGTLGPKSGTKVAPKYRNPLTGQTWTGRGLKPKWLEAALAEGKLLDSFKID